MKPFRLVIAAASVLVACVTAKADESVGRSMPALPEHSLARWYKPQNERQVWLHTMFAMRRELQAVEDYAAAGDRPGLAKWAARLVEDYRRIPEMVPEWSDELNQSAAAELEAAAAGGDLAAATSAARSLGRTCDSCHREFRALVAARFRAPDFSALKVSAGDAEPLGYGEHMDLMSRTLNRIKIASEDHRWEVAADAERDLRAQLALLGGTCESCHADAEPRERILGTASLATLDELRRAIERESEKDSGRYLGEAAVEVCARCHGTHRTLYDLRRQLFPER